MKVNKRQLIEFNIVLVGIAILTLCNTEIALIVSIILTVLILSYIAIAATILPTLKKTVPIFFGNSKELTLQQIKYCVALIACLWFPILFLYGMEGKLI